MYTPFTSRHFTLHIDPESHVRYAVLSTHLAPIQQGFYFVNSGYSDDGRYLWFYCAFPPAAGHALGVIDFLTDEVHYFPETRGGGFMVDPQTGNVYWGCAEGIFMRTPHPEDKPVQIAPLPEFCRRRASGAGTHLTFTPDRREIVADLQTPFGSSIGSFDIVTGEYTEWYRTKPGTPYNHAQVCPTNGDLCMVAHEYSFDTTLGRHVPPAKIDGVYPRLQLIGRDGSRTMQRAYGNYATHEWWAPDGKAIYYCATMGEGEQQAVVARDDLDGTPAKCVWEMPIEGGVGAWHAHCTQDEKYFVIDGSWPTMGSDWWRGVASTVRFYNVESGKTIYIVKYNPVVNGYTPDNECTYHIDPHPRFVLHDTLVTFTVTTQGRVDLAVADVAQLKELSR